jgi:cell division protein FtsZ
MTTNNDKSQKNFFDLFKSNNQDFEKELDNIDEPPEFDLDQNIEIDETLSNLDNNQISEDLSKEYLNEQPPNEEFQEVDVLSNEENFAIESPEKQVDEQSNIIDDDNNIEKLIKHDAEFDNVESKLSNKLKAITNIKKKKNKREKSMSANRKATIKEDKAVLPPIKVVGVGGGGSNAVTRMAENKLEGVQYLAVNTDLQALNNTIAEHKVQIGTHVTRGLGAGSDPVQGRRAADESRELITDALDNAEMVFVTACLGGGTGTGAAPIIAEVARELGALTIGVVTRPFIFEGSKRRQIAEEGIRDLQEKVDTLIVIPNDRLLQICGEDASVEEGFETADNILQQAIQGISELITKPGLVNLDFADVRKIMSNAGPALMAIGSGRGENRAVEAARNAIANPLLEVDITGSTGVLFNITGPEDFTLRELDTAARVVAEVVDPDAEIIFGAAIDHELSDEVRLTIIATGFSTSPSLTLNSEIDEQEIEPIKLADLQVEDTVNSPSDLPTFLRKNFPLR